MAQRGLSPVSTLESRRPLTLDDLAAARPAVRSIVVRYFVSVAVLFGYCATALLIPRFRQGQMTAASWQTLAVTFAFGCIMFGPAFFAFRSRLDRQTELAQRALARAAVRRSATGLSHEVRQTFALFLVIASTVTAFKGIVVDVGFTGALLAFAATYLALAFAVTQSGLYDRGGFDYEVARALINGSLQ